MTVGQYEDHHFSGYDDPTGVPTPIQGPRHDLDLVNEVEALERFYPSLVHFDGAVVATAVVAEVTLEPTGDNNDIDVTAITPGAAGNDITITVVDPEGETDHELPVVTVAGTDITVLLAEDDSDNLSTAAEVIAAVNGHTQASGLVTLANADGNDGTGQMVAVAETSLADGVDAAPTVGRTSLVVDEDDSVWFSLGPVLASSLTAWTQLVDNSA